MAAGNPADSRDHPRQFHDGGTGYRRARPRQGTNSGEAPDIRLRAGDARMDAGGPAQLRSRHRSRRSGHHARRRQGDQVEQPRVSRRGPDLLRRRLAGVPGARSVGHRVPRDRGRSFAGGRRRHLQHECPDRLFRSLASRRAEGRRNPGRLRRGRLHRLHRGTDRQDPGTARHRDRRRRRKVRLGSERLRRRCRDRLQVRKCGRAARRAMPEADRYLLRQCGRRHAAGGGGQHCPVRPHHPVRSDFGL